MRYSENLHLNLPENTDPLEVDRLSENFEVLDTKLGTGIQAIASSMRVGDITYSTRNLEEESGGVLIACDQRTIDTDAYPDLPRNVLYWPYPELVFTDESATKLTPAAYAAHGDDANTDEWIYGNNGSVAHAYSLTEKKVYTSNYSYGLFRVGENKLLNFYPPVPSYLNNNLTAHPDKLPSGIVNLFQYGVAIQRISDSSFFVLSFVTSGNYPTGFYRTDDGFQTLQLIPPSAPTADITTGVFDKGTGALRANAVTKSALYPIKKTDDGEMIVFLGPSVNNVNAPPSSESEKRNKIQSMLPTVWKTSGGISAISKSTAGGDALIDWIADKWTSGAFNIPYVCSIDCKVCAISCMIGSAGYYAISINLKTNEFVAASYPTYPRIMNDMSRVVYNKYKNQVIFLPDNPSQGSVILNTDDLSIQFDVFAAEQPIVPGAEPVNYMDSAVAVGIARNPLDINYARMDKRLFERGASVLSKSAVSLVDADIDGFADFMSMHMGGPRAAYFASAAGNSTSGGRTVPAFTSDVVGAANMTEHNGDIYWPRGASLYKIPKNKRQMPYIKNAYMKVLDEPVEGGAE